MSRPDLYAQITSRIVADLEKGVRPWFKPWSAANTEGRITRPLRVTGEPYKGINVLCLWAEAIANGYQSPTWMTLHQANELGGRVRKGEHGAMSVYADRLRRTTTNDQGEEIEREIPLLKAYMVFNCEQIEGLPERFYVKPAAKPPAWERDQRADTFIANTGAEIKHGGGRAFYNRGADRIQTPPAEAFRDREAYYSTLLHECCHWSGHPKRLDRAFGKRFGDEYYAGEELVAEIGSAFLCADLAMRPEPREDVASYVATWLKVLKDDKRAIFVAAAHAQRAADYLHETQTPSRPAPRAGGQDPAP